MWVALSVREFGTSNVGSTRIRNIESNLGGTICFRTRELYDSLLNCRIQELNLREQPEILSFRIREQFVSAASHSRTRLKPDVQANLLGFHYTNCTCKDRLSSRIRKRDVWSLQIQELSIGGDSMEF
jgi:hypothetical protein